MPQVLLFLLFLPLACLCDLIEDPVELRQPDPLPPSFASDCICPQESSATTHHDPAGSTTSTSDDSDIARIAYTISVHNFRTLEDATPLFQAIRSPKNLIFIHIDTKLDMQIYYNSSLHEEVTACPCRSTVVVDSVHSAEWSTWSMNDPTFWGMEQALLRRGEWDIFINLSGDSLPVYHADVIGRMFGNQLKGINFVTSSSCETGLLPTNVYHFPDWWHKRAHYTTHPTGDVELTYSENEEHGGLVVKNITMEIYFGSQWVALQPDFCHYLISSLKRNDSLPSRFRDYLIYAGRLMTDETFIPTLLMHVAPFNNETSLPSLIPSNGSLVARSEMMALRYERMDEHVPTAFGVVATNQHFDVPESSITDAPKPWGPYYLGVYDLRAIRDSGAVFVRKVSQFVEPNIYQILPVGRKDEIPDLSWPTEVNVSPKVDWQKRMKKWQREYQSKIEVTEQVHGVVQEQEIEITAPSELERDIL